jgi:hypothetical protein
MLEAGALGFVAGIESRLPVTPRSQCQAALKARQLLLRLLTPEQREGYRHSKLVVVRTATASYEISPKNNSVVIARRDGRELPLCIQFAHPADGAWLPAEALMIAKLLLIRTDEAGMWRRFGPRTSALYSPFTLPALAPANIVEP